MDKDLICGATFGERMLALFGLQDQPVKSLSFSVRYDDLLVLTAELYVDKADMEEVTTIFEEYKLVKNG